MTIGRGNRSTERKPAAAPLFPPQIPVDQTLPPTRAAAVGGKPETNRLSYGADMKLCQDIQCPISYKRQVVKANFRAAKFSFLFGIYLIIALSIFMCPAVYKDFAFLLQRFVLWNFISEW
jgi:hypothetical protein